MSQIAIYSISPHFKGNDESHVYWFEKSLGRAVRKIGFDYETITGFDDGSKNIIKALIHTSEQRHKLLFTPWVGILGDVRRIKRSIKQIDRDIIWHVYDGGFREFLLLTTLLIVFRKSKAIFNFTTLEPWLAVVGSPKFTISNTRASISRIKRALGSRLFLLADSLELGAALSSGSNFIDGEYPLFTFLAPRDISSAGSKDSSVVLFSPCNEAELKMCVDAISVIQGENDFFVKPIIQLRWGGRISKSRVAELQKSGIRIIQESLNSEDYERLYSEASVAVMPYLNRPYYRYQSSGRLLDSVSRDCTVVVPDETVLGRKALENNWGFTFSADSATSLASAIRSAGRGALGPSIPPPTAEDAAGILFTGRMLTENAAPRVVPLFSILTIATAPLLELGPGLLLKFYRIGLSSAKSLLKF